MKTKIFSKKTIALLLALTISLFCFAGCSSGGSSASSKESPSFEYKGKNGYYNVNIKACCLIKYNDTIYAAFNIYQKIDDDFRDYIVREISDNNFYLGLNEGEKEFDNLDYTMGYTPSSRTSENAGVRDYVNANYPNISSDDSWTSGIFVDLTKVNMTVEIFDQIKEANDLTAVQLSIFNNELQIFLHAYPDEIVDLSAQ